MALKISLDESAEVVGAPLFEHRQQFGFPQILRFIEITVFKNDLGFRWII